MNLDRAKLNKELKIRFVERALQDHLGSRGLCKRAMGEEKHKDLDGRSNATPFHDI